MNKIVLYIIFINYIVACGGSSDEDNNEKTTGLGNVSGFITSEGTGDTIPDVNENIGDNSMVSNSDGMYIINDVDERHSSAFKVKH